MKTSEGNILISYPPQWSETQRKWKKRVRFDFSYGNICHKQWH